MPRIFISYRRADSMPFVDRLYNDLIPVFGEDNVFRDVHSIAAGANFFATIEREIIHADVVLVVIGATWATITDAAGNRRLDDPDDYVRREIEMALRHQKKIIPVLVDGAVMPTSNDLPNSLFYLPFYNAMLLRGGTDYATDLARLVKALQTVESPLQTPVVQPQDKQQNRVLEAATPACTKIGTETEVRVKISLPDSTGLRGELPDVTPTGEWINKEDVRQSPFRVEFVRDEGTGELQPGTVCVEIITNDFELRPPDRASATCLPTQAELTVPPDYDSDTLYLTLIPAANQQPQLARIQIVVSMGERVVRRLALQTQLVSDFSEHPMCGTWRYDRALVRQQPQPPKFVGGATIGPGGVVTYSSGGRFEYPAASPPAPAAPQASSQRDFDTGTYRPVKSAPARKRILGISTLFLLLIGILILILSSFVFSAILPDRSSSSTPTPDLTATFGLTQTANAAVHPTDVLTASATLTTRDQPDLTANVDGPVALEIGEQAEVLAATVLRSRFGVSQEITDNLPAGLLVTVLEGPVFADGLYWWRVQINPDTEGWMADWFDGTQMLGAVALTPRPTDTPEQVSG